ncbi:MAG TPA: nuclease-related domain-containing protein [Acidimicrobiales bacterium]|nr:nuclease-related domain-containing protein [Acidimicrobiales bacterium]
MGEEEAAGWHDLASNRPGQAVRDKATEAARAAPVKTVLARVLGVRTDERAWGVGADGEVEVGWKLRKLGPRWRVIHSVPVGRGDSDIDHVVIGPPGVFSLNAKNHGRGRVWVAEKVLMVNGQKKDYLRNSRFEAQRASKYLSRACGFDVAVEPVIVVMAGSLTIKAAPAGVQVIGRKQISGWLSRRPATMGTERVEQIFEQARRDSTWRS